MAAITSTTLNEIIVPEVFDAYVQKATMEDSALLQSGIVRNDADLDAKASLGAKTINMPFWTDLGNTDSDAIKGEGTDLTTSALKAIQDSVVILRRGHAFTDTDLASALAGSDAHGAIVKRVAAYWTRDMQRELMAILEGLFTTDGPLSGTHLYSTTDAISGKLITKARYKLGDAADSLTTIAMNSQVKAYLEELDQIEYVVPSQGLPFNTYKGFRVVVDDNIKPVKKGGTGADKDRDIYTTYLFGEGAFSLGNGHPVNEVQTELDRDKRKGSGVNYLINRKTYILHPNGLSFNGTFTGATVERADLKKATAYTKSYTGIDDYDLDKAIKIVALKHTVEA